MKFDPRAAADRSDVVPVDSYIFRLTDIERHRQPTGSEKADYFRVHAAVAQDRTGQWKGAKVSDVMSLSEAAQFRIGQLCLACGTFDAFDIDDDGEVRRVLVGKLFKATTKNEVFKGKDQSRFDEFITISPEERAQLMGKLAGTSAGAAAASEGFLPAPHKPLGDEEQLPF